MGGMESSNTAEQHTKEQNTKKEKRVIDWEVIEREYRAGQLSLREIGALHAVSGAAVHKHVRKEGWKRDLTKRVKQEVDRKLVDSEVDAVNEKDIIKVAAERAVQVIKAHRQDIAKSQSIVQMLQGQLEEAASTRSALDEAIIDETAADKNGGKVDAQRRWKLRQAVSLPSHAGVLRDLSLAQKNLIGLERQAFNLNGHTPEDDPITGITIIGVVGGCDG